MIQCTFQVPKWWRERGDRAKIGLLGLFGLQRGGPWWGLPTIFVAFIHFPVIESTALCRFHRLGPRTLFSLPYKLTCTRWPTYVHNNLTCTRWPSYVHNNLTCNRWPPYVHNNLTCNRWPTYVHNNLTCIERPNLITQLLVRFVDLAHRLWAWHALGKSSGGLLLGGKGREGMVCRELAVGRGVAWDRGTSCVWG